MRDGPSPVGDVTRRLIEDEDVGVIKNSPRNTNPLPLATREFHTPFPDVCLGPVRQVTAELVRARTSGRPLNAIIVRVRPTVRDVLADCSVEKGRLLFGVADASPLTRWRYSRY